MNEDRYRRGVDSAQRSANAYLQDLRDMARSLDRLFKPFIVKALADKADRIVFPRAIWEQAREIDPSLRVPDSDGRLLGGRGKIAGLPVQVED